MAEPLKPCRVIAATYNGSPKEIKYISAPKGTYLFLTDMFNPTGKPENKSPKNVVLKDPKLQIVISHMKTLEMMFMFIGKKTSGSLEIIDLLCTIFKDKKHILFFVLCRHNLKKKIELLKKHGIPETQYIVTRDGHHPCQEVPLLLGFLIEWLEQHC